MQSDILLAPASYPIEVSPPKRMDYDVQQARANVCGTEYNVAFDVVRVLQPIETNFRTGRAVAVVINPAGGGGILNVGKQRASTEVRTNRSGLRCFLIMINK
jgi:hypothetical protein